MAEAQQQERPLMDDTTSNSRGSGCKDCPIRKGKVAKSFPYRIHILRPSEDVLEPSCDCQHLHMTYGKTYKYCTCGEAKAQPFCDESCHGTQWEPLEFTVDKNQRWYLVCGCKQTDSPPHCDGSHIHIDWSKVNDW
eukprot:gb/GECG01003125.1/.p1 GENE.gb/GECG01003125.1/~~gb/GECG01003125.1/.p1  ORF type:complete len:136 (+),score=9.19 gb/GECG01003125.1/:1-408(+)